MAYVQGVGYLPNIDTKNYLLSGMERGQKMQKGALEMEQAKAKAQSAQQQQQALGGYLGGREGALATAGVSPQNIASAQGVLGKGQEQEQATTEQEAMAHAQGAYNVRTAQDKQGAYSRYRQDMIGAGYETPEEMPEQYSPEMDDTLDELIRGGQEFKDVVGTTKGSLGERKLQFQIRDLERKERNTLQQEKLLEGLLGAGPSDNQIISGATDTNITSGGEASIAQLQQERDRLLPALTSKSVAEVVKSKISQIDDQIKFQRSLSKEKRKLEEKMTPEQAAKVALLRVGSDQLEEAVELITDKNGKFNDTDVATMTFGVPFTGGRNARSLFLSAINAQLRSESGAAVPEEEVQRGFQRFVPQMGDDQKTRESKVNSLRALFKETGKITKGPVAIAAPEDYSQMSVEELLRIANE